METISPNVQYNTKSTTLDIAKVFFYMFCGLLITFVIAFGGGYLLWRSGNNDLVKVFSIVGAIGMIVDMIVINVVTLKGQHNILIPGIIYAVMIGLMFTSFVLFVPWQLIGMAFGITTLTFALMGLIAFLSKGNLSPLATVAFGLIGGAALLSVVNWIFILVNPSLATPLIWVVSFAVFAFCLLITLYDMWNLKKISEAGAMSNDLALYCAFTIYVDFINIFIRILYYLIIIFGRNR
ncbi:MAG: Bax inhibitor-1 family protein [Bacilli bacterium]|nr:Bax inhibitor-1 family protein [Bacilli bacterium]